MLSQNVVAACSFDLKFHYVLAGWEGSASDMRVLNSALTRRNKLQVPEGIAYISYNIQSKIYLECPSNRTSLWHLTLGYSYLSLSYKSLSLYFPTNSCFSDENMIEAGKYYLVDDKYVNMPGFIAPYIGVPYPSSELSSAYIPQDARELFNQRHSLLRSVTDRIFGALKARFPILTSAPPYPLQTQVKLVVAACAIHNYIRKEKPDDLIFKMYEQHSMLHMEESLPPLEVEQSTMLVDNQVLDIGFDTDQREFSSELRDSIASDMWDDYIRDLSTM